MSIKRTDVLVQEADEGGSHDVPVLAAELHGGLEPIIHHQGQVFVNGVRAVIGELTREQRIEVRPSHLLRSGSAGVFTVSHSLPSFLDTLER